MTVPPFSRAPFQLGGKPVREPITCPFDLDHGGVHGHGRISSDSLGVCASRSPLDTDCFGAHTSLPAGGPVTESAVCQREEKFDKVGPFVNTALWRRGAPSLLLHCGRHCGVCPAAGHFQPRFGDSRASISGRVCISFSALDPPTSRHGKGEHCRASRCVHFRCALL